MCFDGRVSSGWFSWNVKACSNNHWRKLTDEILSELIPDFRPIGSLGLKFSLIFNEKI